MTGYDYDILYVSVIPIYVVYLFLFYFWKKDMPFLKETGEIVSYNLPTTNYAHSSLPN